MTSPTASPDPLTPDTPDDQLAELAEDYLDALLSAASVDVIGVANWWPRAVAALSAAAARATSVRDMVTVTAAKLQIDTLPEPAARAVARVEALLTDPTVFARWRRIAERDAVYVAAMVRLRRADKRQTRKATTPAAPAHEEPTF